MAEESNQNTVLNEVKEQLLLEMATVGCIEVNNNSYRIALHK